MDKPKYQSIFEEETTDLVMSHIDRMGDYCEEDTAENILDSFVSKHTNIFHKYLVCRNPEYFEKYYPIMYDKFKEFLDKPQKEGKIQSSELDDEYLSSLTTYETRENRNEQS